MDTGTGLACVGGSVKATTLGGTDGVCASRRVQPVTARHSGVVGCRSAVGFNRLGRIFRARMILTPTCTA